MIPAIRRNMILNHILLRWYIVIASLGMLISQTNAQPYYFRHYQVENGLSNNTVFCCVQDKQGFMWMGTKDGLNRFNGYSFDVYGSGTDSSGLEDSYIRSLYIAADDSMYVGTRIGVFKYHPLTEKFSIIFRTSHEITAIQKDKQHNLWIICGNRLIKFNETTHEQKIYSRINHPDVTSICLTSTGNVFAGTADGFIETISATSNTITEYNLFNNEKNSYPKWIERLYITRDNKILAGTSSFGVKLFDPGKNISKTILAENKERNGIYVRDFVQVSDSVIWIGTESGIFVYNTRKNNFTNLINETGNNYSLSDNAVYTLCHDKEGGIWAGTYSGGINYYHLQYSVFTKYFPLAHKTNSLSGNVVREICPDKFGNIWIGTEDAGLNKLNLKTNQITQFIPTGSPYNISYPNIHALLAVGNKLLIGTFEHGLDVMDIVSGKVIAHYPNGATGKNLRSRFIVTLLQSRDGTIYAGTRMGLYTFNIQTGEFKNVNGILSDCFIHTLSEDELGNIWIGTMGNGLFIYSSKKNTVTSLSKKFGTLKNAGTQWITTIFRDSENHLWIGTEGCGLIKYKTENDSLENYSTTYGFPGTTVYRIMEDNNKTLWISTSGGLVHFDVQRKKIIKIYTTANGLLSDQFNYNSGYKDSAGRLYFGSVKGMISFNPADLIPSGYYPPIFITNLITGKERYYLTSHNKSLIYDSSKIILNHRQSTFTITFAALSYYAPEMTRYEYNMDGLDKQWRTSTDTKISFTSLPPGTYKFCVRAITENGNTKGRTASLIIQILPSFWESPVAYFIYIVLALGLLLYIFRIYHLVTMEKNKRKIEHAAYEKEKEMYHNKLEFLTNVAHEIRTPLTLIKAPLEKILKQVNDLPAIRKYLFTMQRNTDRMVTLTEELLDFRKTEVTGYGLNLFPADINSLVREIAENFEETASAENINVQLNLSEHPLIANIDKESFTKIVSNLLTNAIKYASHNIVIISKYSQNEYAAIIEFKNDGEKISPDMSEKIFEPFFRLESAKNKAGAGLGLSLSKSLALLHNGSLIMHNDASVYNTFILTLPLTNAKI